MKLDPNRMRFFAGLPPIEADTDPEYPEHEKNEQELFNAAHANMVEVEKMAAARLSQPDLSPDHKNQYENLRACARRCIDEMNKHLKSYKQKV